MSSYGINFNKPLWDPSNFVFTNFTPIYNDFGGYQMPLFGTPSATTDSSNNVDSYENWKKEELKKQQEIAQKSIFLEERAEEIKKTEDLIEAQEKAIKNIEAGKKADGTYVVNVSSLNGPQLKEDGTVDKEAAKPKKKGFWAKAGEWVCSAGAALKNMGKSLIGYDENGKWSLGKCLKNVGITALVVGASFIPVVGPAIGYGLLAYGVVSGGVGVARGISKLNNATSEEEKEQARQDICSGAFVGITSALGLRSLGRSLGSAASSTTGATTGTTAGTTAGATTGTTAGATTGATTGATAGATAGTTAGATTGATAGATAGATTGATAGATAGATTGATAGATAGTTAGATTGATTGAAASSGSVLAKVSSWITKSLKDMTVNAIKATGKAMQADKALIATSGGGLKGFGKAYATKVNTAIKNTNNWSKKYQEKYNEVETSLNNKITELNNKINAETNAAKRTLLQEQKAMLEKNLNELHSISGFKSKTEFDKLNTENSGIVNQKQLSSYTQNSRGGYEINGQSISKQRFDVFKKEMESLQKSYLKDLQKLNQLKESQMRNFAQKPDSHRLELDNYTDASVRAKYNTKSKLKSGIENLTNKINDLNTKIAEIEAKLERATSPRKIRSLKNSLQNMKAQKLQVESELAICNSIKFKSLFKTSSWLKNDYQRYIGGSNLSFSALRSYAGTAITSPGAVAPMTLAQWERNYELPMFGSLTQLSGEQANEILTQFKQQKESYEKALEALNNINTVEEWNNLKAQLKAQQAAAEAQAQTQSLTEQPATK